MKQPNHLLVKSFTLLFLALWIPIVITLAIVNGNRIRDDIAKYEENCTAAAEEYADKVHSRLTDTVGNANSIFLSRWYAHYMNSEGVYETEFDVLKQIEISDQLRILKNAMGFVSDLMIVSPDHDQVITTQGWYSLRDYSRFYQNKASCETDGNALSVAAADGIRAILLRDINSRLHKGYACILVDAPAFAKYADSVRSELITGVRIEVDGALWYADEKAIQDTMAITVRKYGLPQTTFTIYSPTYVSSLLPTRLFSLLFELIVTTLFLVLAAYVFTLINTRPVARLLQRFSQDDHRSVNDAVNYINECVDAVAYRNVFLDDENVTLKKAIAQFIDRNETELLLSMLLSTQMNDYDALYRSAVPPAWSENHYIIVLIRNNAQGEDDEVSLPQLKPPFCENTRLLHILSHEYCLICWLSQGISENESLTRMTEYFDDCLKPQYCYLCSGIQKDIQALHDEYHKLQNAFSLQREAERYLSSDIQLALLSHIKAGRFDACINLIKSNKAIYDPDCFFAFLLHVAMKTGLETKPIQELYHQNEHSRANLWNVVTNLCSLLIQQSLADRGQSNNDIARLMKAYVDDNYDNPDMSVKLLGDCFHIDSTQVSKIFKSELGIHFSDYLLTKRMDMALSLLSESTMSIASVSCEIGYANYLTFKRAFTRYRGMSPKDYRMLFMGAEK